MIPIHQKMEKDEDIIPMNLEPFSFPFFKPGLELEIPDRYAIGPSMLTILFFLFHKKTFYAGREKKGFVLWGRYRKRWFYSTTYIY
jgi:hypothetical protein